VPIIDVSTPAAPIPRAILNFSAFGDDNGTGIAADSSYVYLTTDRNRLFIGQYLTVEDRNGIPPTARITAPAPGSTVIEGSTVPVAVEASDDIAVAAVNLLVNGKVVSTVTTSPYQFNVRMPVGVSSLTLSASAVDLGGNTGTADEVRVSVIPDPGTTVAGEIVDKAGTPVAGATVTCLGIVGTTGLDGSFSIAGVPTVRRITCKVRAVIGGVTQTGFVSLSPVRDGTTSSGAIVIAPPSLLLYSGLRFLVGSNPRSVAVADLNGDGRPDIVTANFNSDNVSVLLHQ